MSAHRLDPSIRAERGFTLIELSVVIIVLALISGAFLASGTRDTEVQNRAAVSARFDAIENALERFRFINGRLPCPAPPRQKESTAAFAREDCSPAVTTLSGVVPVRTLGLPDRMLYDPWNGRIAYRILKSLTASTTYDNAMLNTPVASNFEILDKSGQQINPARTNAVVPWVLISYGPNKAGAYNRMTDSTSADATFNSPTVACPASGYETANCSSARTVRDMAVLGSVVGTTSFDDYVRWRAYVRPVGGSVSAEALVPDIESVEVGETHVCALRNGGKVYCWGANDKGQFGTGATGTFNRPTLAMTTIASTDTLTAYKAATCSLASSAAKCAGENLIATGTYGRIAQSNATTTASTPVAPAGAAGTDWEQLEGSPTFGCGRRAGKIYCFGHNRYGELGTGNMGATASYYNANASLQSGANIDWTLLATGLTNACGLRAGTTLVCWGRAVTGIMPGNTTASTCSDGGTDCGFRLAGTPTAPTMPVPADAAGTVWTSISIGDDHACGVRSTGRVWCWGTNTYRQASPAAATSPPVAMTNVAAGNAVVAFGGSTCVLNAGIVSCWGRNDVGQLGIGNTTDQTTAQTVGLRNVKSLSASQKTVCALRTDHAVWCWGLGTSGQLGSGGNTNSSTPVFVGLP